MGLRAVVARMIGWQVKLIAAAVLVAVIGGILWHDHHQTARANRLAREVSQVTAQMEAERKARAHELKIAKEASDGYQAELRRIRAEPAIGSVRILPARRVPPATSAASGSDASTTGRVEEAAEADSEPIDVGPALDVYGSDCEAVSAQLTALQRWVRSR